VSAANALRSIGLALDCSEDASPSVIAREALRVIAERDELRARLADARPTVVRVALSDAPVPSLCAVETWLRSHGWQRAIYARDAATWSLGGRYCLVDMRPGAIPLRSYHMARIAEAHGTGRDVVLTEMLALDAPGEAS
jgi:hypothetical protein